jgi:hypothetical protein
MFDLWMENSKEYDPTDKWGDENCINGCRKIAANAIRPNGWIRSAKYKVGSPIDMGLKDSNSNGHTGMELGKDYPQWIGGTYREFYLKDGNGSGTFGLIEFNNQIVETMDLSD